MVVALAAPHPLAVEAGLEAARNGGNAVDAALAAAVTLTVVYPHQCAMGGDLIALIRRPDGTQFAVLGAGTAPAAVESVRDSWELIPRSGPHSVTVPGMVAGWSALAELGARGALAGALEEAARRADDGFPISAGLARALANQSAAVLADPGMAAVFAPGGSLISAGETLVQPALAATLRRLAADPADLYTGETARSLVACLRAAGGVHTEEDFSGYAAEVCAPIDLEAAGAVWTVAPPPSGGVVLLGVVAAAGGSDEETLLEACVRGAEARAAHLGDPRSGAVDVDAILALQPASAGVGIDPRPTGDTAAVVSTDDEGWSVTIVQSVYFTFGAGLLDPRSGVLLHNRGSAFSLDPESPAYLRPGARPPHTLTPAIVDRDGTTVVAGCQGGRAQPWILAQLLGDTLGDQSLEAVLDRPRWVIGAQDLGHSELTFVTEPGVPESLVAHARRSGLPHSAWAERADEAGHVQLVRRRPDGRLEAASDPRADGVGALT